MKKIFSIITVLALNIFGLHAQDLTNLKEQKPFHLSGSIGAGTDYYSSNEPDMTRDPFSWNLNGNLTASIYGFSIPLSFVVNQYSTSYTTPFTQFGMSPTYKWLTVHLGYRSMSLNPFVFDGQSFLGGGIELRPGKFRFSGFYGRINKAITEDTTFDHRIEPQYSRIGYGFKIGAGNDGNEFSLSFFHGKDDKGSIPPIKDSLNTLKPQENTAVGGAWSYRLFKVLTFSGDVAFSLLNRDMNFESLDSIGHYEVPKFVRTFSPINYSTVFSYSGRTQLGLTLKGFNISGGYQRIQPDYMSLGTIYMVNDIETYSGNFGTNLFRGHLNLNGSFNAQHNNLSKALISELQTMAGNFSINANLNQHWNLNLNVNGANVYQKDGTMAIDEDVRMNQLMMNYAFSPSFNTYAANKQHTVTASINYTDLVDRNPSTKDMTAGNNINVNGTYDLQFIEKYFGINTGINYSVYSQKDYEYQSTGINVGANIQLLKQHQLSVQGNVGYFLNKSTGDTPGNNTTFSLSSSLTAGKSSFSLYGSYILTPPVNLDPLDKISLVPTAVRTKNFSAGIQYTCQF
ncbi:MAG: hypothetical protein M9898_14385 [Chitinophagaceae bacterium]|nr:hypothetical protein [Chitinophagaceae bacterium]